MDIINLTKSPFGITRQPWRRLALSVATWIDGGRACLGATVFD